MERFWDNVSTGPLGGLSAATFAGVGYVRRSLLPPGYFHVWIRGKWGDAPFPQPGDRTYLLERLLRDAKRNQILVYAVSVMTTHYHAIVYADPLDLSTCMQELHSGYALGFNSRYGRHGHVFSERFSSTPVDEDSVYDRCGYVLGNPVKAGLVDRLQDWPWNWSRHGLENF